MPTTFAKTIDGNDIFAKRAECDAAGNDLSTTYATKNELPNGVPSVTSSDDGKVLKASYTGGTGSFSWETESGGTVTDVEVDGTSVVSGGVASITMPTELVPTVTSNDDSKVLKASYSGGVGSYSWEAESVAVTDVEVNGSSVVSGGVASITIPAQVNADWNSSSGASEILNKPTIPSGAQLVPAATSADADKVLTVDAQGTPAWASAQAPISAGDGISITNNVVSAKVDGTTVSFNASGELQAAAAVTVDQTYNAASTNAQSGTAVAQAVATKEDAFDVGTGLEMDTTGATPTLQVEAPVDIVAGPGIVVDNPDGNTLRVSQASNYEVTLWTGTYSGSVSDSNYITLSENPANFDTVEITIGGGYKSRFRFAGNSTTWSFIQSYANTSSTTIYAARFDRSATTVTCKAANYMQIGANQVNSWQNRDMNVGELQITQVVGIHRTASN